MYAEWEVEIINRLHEPPDHLGFELGFLSHLISLRNQDNSALALKAEASFLDPHVLKFADKVMEAAKNDQCEYYPGHLALMDAALVNLQNDLKGI